MTKNLRVKTTMIAATIPTRTLIISVLIISNNQMINRLALITKGSAYQNVLSVWNFMRVEYAMMRFMLRTRILNWLINWTDIV